MRRAIVTAIEDVGDCFRHVTLDGPALQGVAWLPGQKVQIAMGSAFVTRTYTPMNWDAAAGRTHLLGYMHGEGPGSGWLRGLATGDECDIFGPRASLDTRRAPVQLAIFGDETSLALAHTLVSADKARARCCCFELRDVESGRAVLARLGLEGATLIAQRDDDAHWRQMEAALTPAADAGAFFVLTGKASTIQRLRQSLLGRGVPATRIRTKAYWAPGKCGLD
ncbi:siderophore-interacting protein [Sphingomonas sp. ASY06-1R]|uniref:siderophore-interacting protein n=1 Tax=Sphingomonas sp. ASY06-1R TaxID=3445771 RepID=UPI003FA1F4B9